MLGVPWQRCQFHLRHDAEAHVPKVSMRHGVAQGLRNVFNAPDRPKADWQVGLFVERHRDRTPGSGRGPRRNIPEGLTVLMLPPYHRTRTHTTDWRISTREPSDGREWRRSSRTTLRN